MAVHLIPDICVNCDFSYTRLCTEMELNDEFAIQYAKSYGILPYIKFCSICKNEAYYDSNSKLFRCQKMTVISKKNGRNAILNLQFSKERGLVTLHSVCPKYSVFVLSGVYGRNQLWKLHVTN